MIKVKDVSNPKPLIQATLCDRAKEIYSERERERERGHHDKEKAKQIHSRLTFLRAPKNFLQRERERRGRSVGGWEKKR